MTAQSFDLSEMTGRRLAAIKANRRFACAMVRFHPERVSPKMLGRLKLDAHAQDVQAKRRLEAEMKAQTVLADKRRIFEPLLKAGWTAKKIGEALRCHPNHVYRVAKELGLKVPAPTRGE